MGGGSHAGRRQAPRGGQALDYAQLSQQLEQLRQQLEQLRQQHDTPQTRLHIVGFAKVMGDLIDGVRQVAPFFALAIVICGGVLFAYTRCLRSTAIVVACSLVAVVWQLGLLRLLGQALDPYSVLVPFLVFAIGMSHGAQKMNGILQDVGRGTHRMVAARYTFRRLFLAGLTDLLCDAMGFAVLALIDIRVIQDLAANASIGLAVLVFTNLVLLPVLLSYLGVSPQAMAGLAKLAMVGFNEGQFKWYGLIANDQALGGVQAIAPRELLNKACSFLSLQVFLKDHKAQTLDRVVAEVEGFIADRPSGEVRFMLAAGSAGVEAATNQVVRQAMREMLFWVYGAVTPLCWLTFRSWRATVVAVLPLVLTSMLCETLMVLLGMGVKVATLPVIALGVGIGVDYALHVLAVMLQRLKGGVSVDQAFQHALHFTGRLVMLTGLTLALAVGTWFFSAIKFQADMGILLAFMFLWNMVGALVLLPALARWLLKPAAQPAGTAAPRATPDLNVTPLPHTTP